MTTIQIWPINPSSFYKMSQGQLILGRAHHFFFLAGWQCRGQEEKTRAVVLAPCKERTVSPTDKHLNPSSCLHYHSVHRSPHLTHNSSQNLTHHSSHFRLFWVCVCVCVCVQGRADQPTAGTCTKRVPYKSAAKSTKKLRLYTLFLLS